MNVHEMGSTPHNDLDMFRQRSKVLLHQNAIELKFFEWAYMHQINMTAVVSASRECSPPLFAFKDHILYLYSTFDGKKVTERPTCNQPCRDVATTRYEVSVVDKVNLLSYTDEFITYKKDLTINGMKVIVIFDRYHSHLSL